MLSVFQQNGLCSSQLQSRPETDGQSVNKLILIDLKICRVWLRDLVDKTRGLLTEHLTPAGLVTECHGRFYAGPY